MSDLPETYRKALRALKDQADAAMVMAKDKAAGKAALGDAHQRMSEHDVECKTIVRLLMKSSDPNLTVPTLTEEQLCVLLGMHQRTP